MTIFIGYAIIILHQMQDVNRTIPDEIKKGVAVVNKRVLAEIENTRLMSMFQGATYCGMGRTTFRKWAEEIGAIRKFGSLIRADKKVIDQALDAWPADSASRPGEKIDDQFAGSGGMN